MFTAPTVLLVLLSVASSLLAKPLAFRRDASIAFRNAPALHLQARDAGPGNVSFSNLYSNNSVLQGLDNFNGVGNFDGSQNSQTIVVQETETQCQDVQIEVIQQKLAIIQEIVKQIITEQICDVETQTIVLAQHNGALEVFRDDIQRKTTVRQIGYDTEIASKFSQIFNPDGSLSNSNLNFSGQDVGKNVIIPTGNNWNDATSPALQAGINAAITSALNVTNA
uniref:Uncharacterized protein n=1 Tax=Mycena chlorophos TaxID=658473 RepID=A0ABQ0MBP5_MYCCL|nr:predicted protein [Mycena chlorophos]